MEPPFRVFYVDPDPRGRELVRQTLHDQAEFELVAIDAVETELERLRSAGAFDVVLSELNVLGFEGLEIIEAVRNISPDTPVVIITAAGSEEIVVQAWQAGAAGYVVKTAEQIDRLPQTLSSAIEQAESRQTKRRTREELESRESLYRRALLASSAAVYQRDFASNTYTHQDSNIEHLLEVSADALTPDAWRQLIRQTIFHGKAAGLSLEQVEGLFRAGKIDVLASDDKCITPSGKTVWLSDTAVPVYDQQGRVTGSIGLRQDITERKHLEEALTRTHAVLEATFNNLADALFVVDPQTRVVLTCNPAVEHVSGYAPEEIVGRNVAFLYSDRAAYEETGRQMFSALDASGRYSSETQLRRKNGQLADVEHTVSQILDYEGRRVAIVSLVRDISHRKRAEREIRQNREAAEASRQQLLIAIESLTEGFALYDADDRLVICNSIYREQYDLSQDLLAPGAKFEEHIRASAYRGQIQEAVGREEQWVRERVEQHRHPQGKYLQQLGNGRWLLVSEHSTKDGGIVGVRRDITESKRAEEELRESEERFRQLAESLDQVLWFSSVNPERITYVSPAFADIWGRSETALYEDPGLWVEAIHDDDRQRVRDIFTEWIEGREPEYRVEYRVVRPDGETRWVHDHGLIIRDAYGQIVRLSGIVRDITEEKRADEKIRYQSQLLDSVQEAVVATDLSGVIVYWGKGAERLYGYSADEALGSILAVLTNNDGELADFHRMSQILNTGSWAGRQELHHKDGEPFTSDTFISLVTGEFDEPCGFIGIYRDVSAHEEHLAQLRERDAELAHVSRLGLLGEMAAEISHEINQPLYAISNCAMACSKSIKLAAPDSPERTLACVREISQQAHRAGEIVRRMRSFSRKTPFSLSTVNLSMLVQETIELLSGNTKNLAISVSFQAAEQPHAVLVDRIQIQQVIVNLIRNACDAMADIPSQQRQLQISTAFNDEDVVFSAADSGAGMPLENLERVFEPFYTTKPEGVGLGLAISQRIIKKHRGRIWATPNAEQGTTFHFSLPRHDADYE